MEAHLKKENHGQLGTSSVWNKFEQSVRPPNCLVFISHWKPKGVLLLLSRGIWQC